MSDVPKLLLTSSEACQSLSISRRTLYSLSKSGELPSVKIGKTGVRFSTEALRKWIDQQQNQSVNA